MANRFPLNPAIRAVAVEYMERAGRNAEHNPSRAARHYAQAAAQFRLSGGEDAESIASCMDGCAASMRAVVAADILLAKV